MNKRTVAVAMISAAIAGAAVFAAMALVLRPTPLVIDAVDLSRVADGEYVGTCQNKLLTAVVRVLVEDHQISDVEVLSHKPSYIQQANETAARIIEAQSPDVDAVSGATLTSDTVMKAAEDALRKGLNR